MRKNIVGDDQVRMAVLGDDLSCHFGAEEGDACGHAPGGCGLRHIGGGLDAKDPLTEREKMLQEIAVIAAQLDDEIVGAKVEARSNHLAIALRMRHPTRRIRREIRVFREDMRRTYELGELHQPTGVANADMERVIALSHAELLLGEEAFA